MKISRIFISIFKALTILVSTASCHLSVSVFLYELAFSAVVTVSAFKSFTFFGFLDAGTLTLTISINTLETVAIGIVNNHLTIHLTFSEFTFKDITRFLGQFTSTILQVIFPTTYVDIPVFQIKVPCPFRRPSRNCPVYFAPFTDLKIPSPVRSPCT